MHRVRLATVFGPAPCASCGRREGWLCTDCVRDARPATAGPPPSDVDRIVAAWAYEGGPRSLVLGLKLRHLSRAAGPLVVAMVDAARRTALDADRFTWVPARPSDISARGFDHAELLARGVARRLGLPATALLRRRGVQLDQSGLDRTRRLQNLEGAFVAPRTVPQRVLLVDDLITTGATATACARALKASGARQVTLLAACRA